MISSGIVSASSWMWVRQRVLAPRGTTPLLDVDRENECLPEAYRNRNWSLEDQGGYFCLLERGATRLMCETFELEFSQQHGILACADDEIYETFSGWRMALAL
jgi:hypothetical protein